MQLRVTTKRKGLGFRSFETEEGIKYQCQHCFSIDQVTCVFTICDGMTRNVECKLWSLFYSPSQISLCIYCRQTVCAHVCTSLFMGRRVLQIARESQLLLKCVCGSTIKQINANFPIVFLLAWYNHDLACFVNISCATHFCFYASDMPECFSTSCMC